jgi:membrane protease YdiL (CAAX protease family)
MTPARIIRALTIVLLAPLAEEVALRGTMYGDFEKRRFHPALTVLAPAIVFTLIHFQYSGLGLVYIFIDGVIFGLARRDTKSLFVPILLHSLGNAYAVWERIF